ncbi:enolase C-terminal domain-like protein [Streptomyces montanisoli]|uniref:Mandelate racemase/muconate lactonizing enzyme C-terminal domain-containing protein n=1 Tax=Streptomyces montanisoli TaxID=2798581 RepID=A0A940MIB7_9ACTN|nr:enolase C-terminal domain-like protein [Streptomyces montanisoli]MBP0459093.1 hypothetical protein [Streptomyces montanisoli]
MNGPAVRSVEATPVLLPMRRPLGTSVSSIGEAPMVLIDLHTDEGVTGRSYLFCYAEALAHAVVTLVRDAGARLAGDPAEPAACRRTLSSHFKLVGVRGPVASVLAGVDAACWDALAQAAGLPLARLLGAAPRPVPAYNSNGLGLLPPQAVADEALELAAEGFSAVKMRLGRPSARDDLAAVRAVRGALPEHVAVMADFNQALSLADAQDRCRALDDEGLYWIEEPVRHDDYEGAARLAAALRTPVQAGENLAGPRAMAHSLRLGASDYVMPDLDRIGGVSGWRDAAALADVSGVPMSSHLYPEVSAQLLAATPTAHWLEYVDWAAPVLETPLRIAEGCALPSEAPGSGLRWDAGAVAHHRMD